MSALTAPTRGAKLAAVVVSVAIAAGLAAASSSGGRRPAAAAAFRSGALLRDAGARLAARGVAQVSWHGGGVTLASGERLTVFVSDAFTEDAGSVQQWGEFFGGLIHGSELAQVTAYIATPDEVAGMCESTDALGCYADDRLVVTGEAVDGIEPQEIARHEYGHHVAAHRANPPWQALDWGPKRWATAEHICGRERAGQVFPGDEGPNYTLNPGEAFAESYRVLNDVRSLGVAVDWRLSDGSFLPTAAVLQAVADDVLHPWSAPGPVVARAHLGAGRRTWSARVATPLDGTLEVTLAYPRGTRDDLALMDGSRVVARGAPSGPTSARLSSLVCGQRSLTLRVTSRVGAGTFSLRVDRP